MNGAQMYSTVKIGSSNILGKIVKLSGDTATIQCFGSTSIIELMQTGLQLETK